MPDPFRLEKIENWVADFVESDRLRRFPGHAQECAPAVLTAFLIRACDHRGRGPDVVEEEDVRRGLLEGAARIDVPEVARGEVPGLCGAFLEEMESQGRVGGGRSLAVFLQALKPAFLEAARGRPEPIVRPASKVGRNDPCPCGSGRKYKKCCMRALS